MIAHGFNFFLKQQQGTPFLPLLCFAASTAAVTADTDAITAAVTFTLPWLLLVHAASLVRGRANGRMDGLITWNLSVILFCFVVFRCVVFVCVTTAVFCFFKTDYSRQRADHGVSLGPNRGEAASG